MARERNGVYAISAALAFLHVPQMYTCPCADFGAHALIAQIDVTSAGAADALRDATRQVDADIFTLNQVFSLAYAALSSFCSLSRDAQDSLCDLATSSVQHATRACKRALLASAADAHLAECRTSLTVAVYLLSWFVQEAEKQEATRMLAAAAGKTVKAGELSWRAMNKVFIARHVGHTEQTRALRWPLVSPSTLIPSKITYTGQLCKCDAQENTSPPEADRATLTHMHFNLGPYRVPAAVADNLSHQSWRGEAVEAAGFQHHDALCIIKRALDNHGQAPATVRASQLD